MHHSDYSAIKAVFKYVHAYFKTARLQKSAVQSFSGWLSRMTTNYRKYVECITVILQEFIAHTGTTNLKSSVQRLQSFSGQLSRMITNYRKYVERITVILQEFIAHTGTTNLKSSVLLIARNFACMRSQKVQLFCFTDQVPDVGD